MQFLGETGQNGQASNSVSNTSSLSIFGETETHVATFKSLPVTILVLDEGKVTAVGARRNVHPARPIPQPGNTFFIGLRSLLW